MRQSFAILSFVACAAAADSIQFVFPGGSYLYPTNSAFDLT
jgi:hypothetical protein